MSGDFLDSNVFLYTFERQDPRKRSIAKQLIRDGLQRGDADSLTVENPFL